jgi:tetratricopeptide (TPR) repeat protein
LLDWAWALGSQQDFDKAAGKFQEAIDVDREDPWTYHHFGLFLAGQEHFAKAIVQYREADERWQKKESEDRKDTLWAWGNALGEQEKFDAAADKYKLATEIVPKEATAILAYGNSLGEQGRYRDSIVQYDTAAKLDSGDPYPRHSKGATLFQLGRYDEGWKEWHAARKCYERALNGELHGAEQLEKTVYFAGLLRRIFKDYKTSEGFYRQVLERRGDHADAPRRPRHSLPAMGEFG